MLRKLIWLFVIFPLGAICVALALANRHAVRLVLDPFSSENPFLAFEAPFFLYLIGALLLGLVLGGFATWLGQGKWRREARNRAREVRSLNAETRQLNSRIKALGDEPLEHPGAAE